MRYNLLIFILLFTLLSTSYAENIELIKNGGFSEGLADWTTATRESSYCTGINAPSVSDGYLKAYSQANGCCWSSYEQTVDVSSLSPEEKNTIALSFDSSFIDGYISYCNTHCGGGSTCSYAYNRLDFLSKEGSDIGKAWFWHNLQDSSETNVNANCVNAKNSYSYNSNKEWQNNKYVISSVKPSDVKLDDVGSLKFYGYVYTCSGTPYNLLDNVSIYYEKKKAVIEKPVTPPPTEPEPITPPIPVKEKPSNEKVELITNGDFNSGTSGWKTDTRKSTICTGNNVPSVAKGYLETTGIAQGCCWASYEQTIDIKGLTTLQKESLILSFEDKYAANYGGKCTAGCGGGNTCGYGYNKLEYLSTDSGSTGSAWFYNYLKGSESNGIKSECVDSNNNYYEHSNREWANYEYNINEIKPDGVELSKIDRLKFSGYIYTCGTDSKSFLDKVSLAYYTEKQKPVESLFIAKIQILLLDDNNVIPRSIITGGTEPFSYEWNFGDGTDADSNKDPIHDYSETGTYTIALRVIDTEGRIAEASKEVVIQRIEHIKPEKSKSTAKITQTEKTINKKNDGIELILKYTINDKLNNPVAPTSCIPNFEYPESQAVTKINENDVSFSYLLKYLDQGVKDFTHEVTCEKERYVIKTYSEVITLDTNLPFVELSRQVSLGSEFKEDASDSALCAVDSCVYKNVCYIPGSHKFDVEDPTFLYPPEMRYVNFKEACVNSKWQDCLVDSDCKNGNYCNNGVCINTFLELFNKKNSFTCNNNVLEESEKYCCVKDYESTVSTSEVDAYTIKELIAEQDIEYRTPGQGPSKTIFVRKKPNFILDTIFSGNEKRTKDGLKKYTDTEFLLKVDNSFFKVVIKKDIINTLKKDNFEVFDYPTPKIMLNEVNSIIKSDYVKNTFGATGNGVTIAVLDTGVDKSHPDLKDAVTNEKAFISEQLTNPFCYGETIYNKEVDMSGYIGKEVIISYDFFNSLFTGQNCNQIYGTVTLNDYVMRIKDTAGKTIYEVPSSNVGTLSKKFLVEAPTYTVNIEKISQEQFKCIGSPEMCNRLNQCNWKPNNLIYLFEYSFDLSIKESPLLMMFNNEYVSDKKPEGLNGGENSRIFYVGYLEYTTEEKIPMVLYSESGTEIPGYPTQQIIDSYALDLDSNGVYDDYSPLVTKNEITFDRMVMTLSSIPSAYPLSSEYWSSPLIIFRVERIGNFIEPIATSEYITDDLNGHGTHVSGTALGRGTTYTGIANGANLMNLKVLNSYGSGTFSAAIDAINYAVDNGANIISMSLGASDYDPQYCTSGPLYNAITRAIQNNVKVVVAAGNSGPNSGTIAYPGCIPEVITVGSTSKTETPTISRFSSRGPTELGHTKPDVVAPGENVIAPRASKSNRAKYDEGGFYTKLSGTSMATPAVAGSIALLLEKNSELSQEEIKQLLSITSTDLGYDANSQGYGLIDNEKLYSEG